MLPIPRYIELPEYQKLHDFVHTADLMSRAIGNFCEQNRDLNGLERATLQIAAGSFAILFSVRELVAAGYLLPAKILLRSLLDRVSTIAWLRSNGEHGLNVWERGWRQKERPKTLQEKLNCLYEFALFDDVGGESFGNILADEFVDILHGEVHGDLQSTLRNSSVEGPTIEMMAAGPNPHHAEECAAISKLATALIAQFLKEIQVAIPRLLTRDAG